MKVTQLEEPYLNFLLPTGGVGATKLETYNTGETEWPEFMFIQLMMRQATPAPLQAGYSFTQMFEQDWSLLTVKCSFSVRYAFHFYTINYSPNIYPLCLRITFCLLTMPRLALVHRILSQGEESPFPPLAPGCIYLMERLCLNFYISLFVRIHFIFTSDSSGNFTLIKFFSFAIFLSIFVLLQHLTKLFLCVVLLWCAFCVSVCLLGGLGLLGVMVMWLCYFCMLLLFLFFGVFLLLVLCSLCYSSLDGVFFLYFPWVYFCEFLVWVLCLGLSVLFPLLHGLVSPCTWHMLVAHFLCVLLLLTGSSMASAISFKSLSMVWTILSRPQPH